MLMTARQVVLEAVDNNPLSSVAQECELKLYINNCFFVILNYYILKKIFKKAVSKQMYTAVSNLFMFCNETATILYFYEFEKNLEKGSQGKPVSEV